METIRQPLSVFYSYDEKDKDLLSQLNNHLANMERQQLIKGWHNQNISPGIDWKSAVNEHLESDQIILLLISPDFIASDYCYSVEMTRAMERHNSGDAYVIPVLLRPCEFTGAPFSKLALLPSNGKPVKSWSDSDEAFQDVAIGIRKVVEGYLPRTREQWLDEGKKYHGKQLYEKALVAYEGALRLDANYARAQRGKGDALYDLKRYAEALEAYTRALDLDPSSTRVHRNMAWLYNEKGDALFGQKRYAEALQAYEQAVGHAPNFAKAHNNKGTALSRLKRYQEAVVAYEQASQCDSTFALPYNNKGRALFHLGYYQASLLAYEYAIQRDPNFAQAYDNAADTLEKLGKIHEAALTRTKARELRNKH